MLVYVVHDICKNLKNQKLPSSSDSLRSQSEEEKVECCCLKNHRISTWDDVYVKRNNYI